MKLAERTLLIILLSAVVLVSCTTDKNPTISLLNGRYITTNQTISPGGALSFKWMAEKGKADLSSFTIKVNGDDLYGFPITTIEPDIYADSTFLEGPVSTGDYAYSFVVTDTDGNIGEKALVITVN